MWQYLGVRVPFKHVAPCLQIVPEISMVVNLAVEDGPDGPILICHRLSSSRRQVDDAEACVDQSCPRPRFNSLRIGTTVAQGTHHAPGMTFVVGQISQPSRYSAHNRESLELSLEKSLESCARRTHRRNCKHVRCWSSGSLG